MRKPRSLLPDAGRLHRLGFATIGVNLRVHTGSCLSGGRVPGARGRDPHRFCPGASQDCFCRGGWPPSHQPAWPHGLRTFSLLPPPLACLDLLAGLCHKRSVLSSVRLLVSGSLVCHLTPGSSAHCPPLTSAWSLHVVLTCLPSVSKRNRTGLGVSRPSGPGRPRSQYNTSCPARR